jgi:hypothetical protein
VFRIRNSQIATLAAERSARFERSMVEHLRRHFPGATASFDDSHLLKLVSATIARARQYQLFSESDFCRFLNLAATFGWEFDTDPDCAWMTAMLTDPSVSAPKDRIHLLVDESLRRLRVQEHNEKLRAVFAQKSPE